MIESFSLWPYDSPSKTSALHDAQSFLRCGSIGVSEMGAAVDNAVGGGFLQVSKEHQEHLHSGNQKSLATNSFRKVSVNHNLFIRNFDRLSLNFEKFPEVCILQFGFKADVLTTSESCSHNILYGCVIYAYLIDVHGGYPRPTMLVKTDFIRNPYYNRRVSTI